MLRQITEAQLGIGDETYRYTRHFVQLTEEQKITDIFDPRMWGQLEKQSRLRINDIVRVRAYDGSFDLQVTVISMAKGAANVELWPKLPPDIADLTKPRAIQVAPMDHLGQSVIRVMKAGDRYRVNGLEHQEVSSHATIQEAEGAMAAYLAQVRMRAPTAEESEAHAEQQAILAEEREQQIADKKEALQKKIDARKGREAAQKRHTLSA